MVKVTLLELASSLSAPAADEKQWFIHLSFNLTLQLINNISGYLQKLLRYFNGRATVVFFKIPFALPAIMFLNNLALYLKDVKVLLSAILALKLVASS